jgi:hypothetical protein
MAKSSDGLTAYKGMINARLMNLYYENAIQATHQKRKEDYFKKAQDCFNDIDEPEDSHYDIFDEITAQLSKLGQVSTKATASVAAAQPAVSPVDKASNGSEVDSAARMLSAATLSPSAKEAPVKPAAVTTVERSLKGGLPIPEIARGHEEIYQRFVNGALIYRPNGDGADTGMITIPLSALSNPLEGEFDLSRCGDAGKYLSINTGYKKSKISSNANKVEIWITPKFVIDNALNTTAKHFKDISSKWTTDATVGMFWTWGGSEIVSGNYDYLINKFPDELILNNFYDNWKSETRVERLRFKITISWMFNDQLHGAAVKFFLKI